MTDFNLSEKAKEQQISCPDGRIGCLVYHFKRVYSEEDVKEFIRLLKEEVKVSFEVTTDYFNRVIDKLAGEELI
jgi:hypothetical protein